jgi:hypothetical protein
MGPGRACPPHYGYSPRVFARDAELAADMAFTVEHALGREALACSA